jgi:hypothetical protein
METVEIAPAIVVIDAQEIVGRGASRDVHVGKSRPHVLHKRERGN